MGEVIRFPKHHARAPSSASRTRRKSLALTSPSVTAAIFSATSRDGQPLPSQSDVIQPAETPMETAKSPRLIDLDFRYSDSFMTVAFSLTNTSVQEKILVSPCGRLEGVGRNFGMSKARHKPLETRRKRPKFRLTFIRQYRKKQGMTLDQLGEKAGMTGGNLSEIENGNTAYTQATLEALADALQCEPVDLLIRDPNDPEGIWSLWDMASPTQRKQISKIIEAVLNSEVA